eukprot:215083-Amphidinium_carterae.4
MASWINFQQGMSHTSAPLGQQPSNVRIHVGDPLGVGPHANVSMRVLQHLEKHLEVRVGGVMAMAKTKLDILFALRLSISISKTAGLAVPEATQRPERVRVALWCSGETYCFILTQERRQPEPYQAVTLAVKQNGMAISEEQRNSSTLSNFSGMSI